MSRFYILAVGRLKEKWLRDGCAEYEKRIGAWGGVSIYEAPESRLPSEPSAAQIENCLRLEGENLLAHLPSGAAVAALCIEGRQYRSEQLAGLLMDQAQAGQGKIAFIIGGSHGLSPQVKERAQFSISMSAVTFPHQLARLMLLEQLYRALSISSGGKYHK